MDKPDDALKATDIGDGNVAYSKITVTPSQQAGLRAITTAARLVVPPGVMFDVVCSKTEGGRVKGFISLLDVEGDSVDDALAQMMTHLGVAVGLRGQALERANAELIAASRSNPVSAPAAAEYDRLLEKLRGAPPSQGNA